MRMSLFVSSSVSALSGRLPPSTCASAAWAPQVVGHAVGSGPARDRRLGAPWLLPRAAVGKNRLDQVLALAEPIGPSRLPMR